MKAVKIMIAALLLAALAVSSAYAVSKAETFSAGGYQFKIWYDTEDPDSYSLYITGYTGQETDLVFPTSVRYNGKEYKVRDIYEEAFAGSNITSVVIPDGYEYVGAKAFYGCENLKSVSFSTIQWFGTYKKEEGQYVSEAFAGCPNLKTYHVDMPDGSSTSNNLGIGKTKTGISTRA